MNLPYRLSRPARPGKSIVRLGTNGRATTSDPGTGGLRPAATMADGDCRVHPPDARHPPGRSASARGPALHRRAQARRPARPAPRARTSHRARVQPPWPGADSAFPGWPGSATLRWPIASAVLDGEAVAGDGSEGIQAVFEARHRPGSPMAFTAFDLLELDGQSVMGEPWTARRKRLEDLLEPPPLGICLVPVTDDAPALWDAWVGMGGEGIVLKERTLALPPRGPLAGLAQAQAEALARCGRDGRIRGAHPVERLGRGRDARASATRIRGPAPTWRSARRCASPAISPSI